MATVTKNRDGPGGAKIPFRLRMVELGRDQDGDPVITCVVEPADWVPPPTARKPAPQHQRALDLLNAAVAEKGERRVVDGSEIRAVPLNVWEGYLAKSGLFGNGKPGEKDGKFRAAWSRIRSALAGGEHVETLDGYVWPARPTLRFGEAPPF